MGLRNDCLKRQRNKQRSNRKQMTLQNGGQSKALLLRYMATPDAEKDEFLDQLSTAQLLRLLVAAETRALMPKCGFNLAEVEMLRAAHQRSTQAASDAGALPPSLHDSDEA